MATVRRADTSDLDRICRSLVRAFADDPLVRWMLPDDDAYLGRDGDAFFRLVSRRWFEVGEVWTTPDCVAASVWGPPDPPGLPDAVSAELGALYMGFDVATQARMAAVSAAVGSHRPDGPYWYLQFLGTHPDWQRQGLGSALLAPLRERCDTEGLGQYLETATDDDIAYYRARGFDVLESFDVHDSEEPSRAPVTVTTMWRPAGRG